MFFRNIVVNLVDLDHGDLLISGQDPGSYVRVVYWGAKIKMNGTTVPMAPDQKGVYSVPVGKTIRDTIKLIHDAFKGGYGAISLTSTDSQGNAGYKPLMGYIELGNPQAAYAIGEGQLFRFPVVPPAGVTDHYKIAITNPNDNQPVKVTANGVSATYTVPQGYTLLWDSAQQSGVNLNQPGFVEVEGTKHPISVSAALYRGSNLVEHIYPVELTAVS